MGYIRHHAIVVTSFDEEELEKARNKAVRLFNRPIGAIVKGTTNGYATFVIPPDGSKEGWNTSELNNKKREKYIEWLKYERFDDGTSVLDWVELQYGDDGRQTKIINDSDEHFREDN